MDDGRLLVLVAAGALCAGVGTTETGRGTEDISHRGNEEGNDLEIWRCRDLGMGFEDVVLYLYRNSHLVDFQFFTLPFFFLFREDLAGWKPGGTGLDARWTAVGAQLVRTYPRESIRRVRDYY